MNLINTNQPGKKTLTTPPPKCIAGGTLHIKSCLDKAKCLDIDNKALSSNTWWDETAAKDYTSVQVIFKGPSDSVLFLTEGGIHCLDNKRWQEIEPGREGSASFDIRPPTVQELRREVPVGS